MPRSKTLRRGPGRPPRGEDVAVRDQLIEAAIELFTLRGYGEVSLREIADKAEVTPAMVAYYFDDKRGLHQAMLGRVLEQLLEQIDVLRQAVEENDPIEQFIDLYISTLAAQPWAPRLIVREVLTGDTPLRTWFVERFAAVAGPRMTEWLSEQIDSGELRDDLDPRLALLSLIGMSMFPFLAAPVLGPILEYRIDGEFKDRIIRHTQTLFREGCRAPGR